MNGRANSEEAVLMSSVFSGCFAEDIKEGEDVMDECKAKDLKMPLEDQVLQGKGQFGVMCGEDDLFGEMLQNQMLQGKDLSGEVLCEEEERHLWDAMEDFSNENPTPASTLTALSPLPTPRYVAIS